MAIDKKFQVIFFLVIGFLILIFIFSKYRINSRATIQKANLRINAGKITKPLPFNWKAFAQGGEETGVRMLGNVIPQIAGFSPRYIRIDHIYDFYQVVSRDINNNLQLNWDLLDQTVCDIYHTGARPFFSLGYMPPALSKDGSLVSPPSNWVDWSYLVQKTIERYSGINTRLCGQVTGDWLKDIYYEVWNEPDLETFGKWSIYGGDKDYKTLYYYSVLGASKAKNVYQFLIGGPATTAAYKNWFQYFLNYLNKNNLRIDFLSWHHYSKNPDDFRDDVEKINFWLSDFPYNRYLSLPKIISEWAYDSNPNPVAETDLGATHSLMVIKNLIEQNLEMAFAFEIKDGPTPSWGILSYDGQKKPRFYALKFLNLLGRNRLEVDGEGSYVKALASQGYNKISAIIINYDPEEKNKELVPVTFFNLDPGSYQLSIYDLKSENPLTSVVTISNGQYRRFFDMSPNSAYAIELIKLN
ncbi:MAG: glycosyl hydrolase [Microgenomates group bacterium]|nr:glycosyl hydrolase [Microgenomates group bacterium]